MSMQTMQEVIDRLPTLQPDELLKVVYAMSNAQKEQVRSALCPPVQPSPTPVRT